MSLLAALTVENEDIWKSTKLDSPAEPQLMLNGNFVEIEGCS